jgi:tetratricopeptide (TPR) repeat protein
MPAWKNIPVFLSSTFRDMHAERDYLIKVTFPALREKLLPYRFELFDIDLRWGITEDEAKNEQVISLCLEQVDQCRPFFLAFLGERYGWIPSQVPSDTQTRFPLVTKFPGVSVTELELRHGILNAENAPRAMVLLRKPETLETIPPATRQRDFTEADDAVLARLERLKQELLAGPFPVQPYTAEWNPNLYDRVNHSHGKLDGLKEFGDAVEQWLWQAIREEYQLPEKPPTVDPLDAEADLHERFVELRTRIYFGRDDLYKQLKTFALEHGEKPLLITALSGLGKSAALARFVRDLRREHPEVFVLAHFVGASPRTTSLPTILDRLTQELQRHLNLTLPEAKSPDEIIRNFITAIDLVPNDLQVVLVFDALNQLDADERANTLIWLPETLPRNVRVLCSAATGPQQMPRVLTAFGDRDFEHIELKPLALGDRLSIIKNVPKLVAKTLDEQQTKLLLTNPATENPLFLMVALEELRGYGSFENLNEVILALPRAGDTVQKLFGQVFERLEQEFGDKLVLEVSRCLACARRGLSSRELESLTSYLGEDSDNLYPLLRQLRPYLQSRDGILDFYHQSLRSAVETRYLGWSTDQGQRDPWSRWQPDRQPPASDLTESEVSARELLVAYFQMRRRSPRSVDELPWQLAQLRDWRQLFDLLGDLEFFSTAYYLNEWDLREYWSMLSRIRNLQPIEAYRTVLSQPELYNNNALRRLALFLDTTGEGRYVLPLWSTLIDRFRIDGDDINLHAIEMNRALLLRRQGDLDGALAAMKEGEKIFRRRNNLDALHRSLGNQALILSDQGDLPGAMALHREEESLCRQLNDPESLQSSLNNQAIILRKKGEYANAMALYKESEAISRRLNNHDSLAGSLMNQAEIHRRKGQLTDAMALNKKAEAIFRRLNNPRGLQSCLGNQAIIHHDQGDLDQALKLHREAEVIYRRLNEPEKLATALNNQALILQSQGELVAAMAMYKESEAIYRRLNIPDGLQSCLGNQANILSSQGELDQALKLHEEEESICRHLNNPDGLQAALGNRAMILRSLGDVESARALLKEKEAICRRINNPAGLASCLGNQAIILAEQGNLDGSMDLLKEVGRIFRQLKNQNGLAITLGKQALILSDQGDLAGAMALQKEEEAIFRRLNNAQGLQSSLGNHALTLRADGNLDGALVLLKEQEAICHRVNNPASLATCLGNQANIHADQGNLAVALTLHKEAELIFRSLQNRRDLAISLENQALILEYQGNLTGALNLLREAEVVFRSLGHYRDLAIAIEHQALILENQRDPAGALALHKEVEAIFRRLSYPEGVANSLVNQGEIVGLKLGQPERGLVLAEEGLRMAKQQDDAELIAHAESILVQLRQTLA